MLYFLDNKYNFYSNRVNFVSSQEGKQTAYCNNTQDYIDMVKNYPWQFSNLVSEVFVPTEDQKIRLDVLNNIEAANKNTYESECVLFVEHGAILEHTKAEFLKDIADQYIQETQSYIEKQQQAIITQLTTALTDYFDSVAAEKNYGNRITCAVRAGYPGPFQAEGQAFAIWMDTCNAAAYQILAEVLEGTRPVPNGFEEIKSELPSFTWPEIYQT